MPPRRRLPWVTLLVVLLTLFVWLLPAATAIFIYDRPAILQGQIWRLWTGHLCHFSPSHLFWDLLATALASAWMEMAAFPGCRRLWFFVPPLISLTLLVARADLQYYGGLSGMATACVVFASLGEASRPGASRFIWPAVLVAVGLKIGWEYLTGDILFASFGAPTVHSVPISHAAGAVVAGGFSQVVRATARVKGPPPVPNKKLTNVSEWQH